MTSWRTRSRCYISSVSFKHGCHHVCAPNVIGLFTPCIVTRFSFHAPSFRFTKANFFLEIREKMRNQNTVRIFSKSIFTSKWLRLTLIVNRPTCTKQITLQVSYYIETKKINFCVSVSADHRVCSDNTGKKIFFHPWYMYFSISVGTGRCLGLCLSLVILYGCLCLFVQPG
jgi:hypothetical protein